MIRSALLIVAAAVVVTEISVFATSIYLHRALAHRALALHPLVEHVFRWAIWLTLGLSRQEWVAVHRKHHTFTDVPGDPHSPRLLGLWNVQFGNIYYYLREARTPHVLATWAPDLAPDRWDRLLFSRSLAGIGAGLGILMVAIGWGPGLAAGCLHAVLNGLVLAPLINGLGHWRGQQNFDNTAYNNRWLALATGGESLHNNHHAHPRSAKFSVAPGEVDPSWPLIRALVGLGLASTRPPG